VRAARWTPDGALELRGDLRAAGSAIELVLRGRRSLHELAFALERSGRAFRARLTPAAIPSLAGVRPLSRDAWDLLIRGAGDAEAVPVTLSAERYAELPIGAVIDHKPFRLGATRDGDAVLLVDRDRDAGERGRRQQRRLRATVYGGGRGAPLRDAVVYLCYGGRQYADNPRAIHEELVRRGAPLEHLWVVRDGRCRVPGTAAVLRSGSADYYQALAQARYVVSNDHFPVWFERRPGQVCLQTWHGTPLKRLGFDVPGDRKFARRWDRQVDNWQYVLSPNRFSTPIMRRAYALTGELLETGYPRVDQLAGDDRDRLGAAVRRRLGLPDHAQVVLYAPTYRDHARDRDGRYRLEPALEVERLRGALGPDAVVLFRKHHYVVDPVPATADGFVRDVSDYPDGTELLLAADVLVTDYSSMMFDFAITGRPMVFFTYDLDANRDEIRGFYFDFEARAPGPLVGTTGELAERLRDLGAVTAEHASRYQAFVADFCELDDGHAAARVVDRVFDAPAPGVSSDQGRRVVA
jgi:CDP-glycerol glycerophosphotransferase